MAKTYPRPAMKFGRRIVTFRDCPGYRILVSELKTPEELLGWVYHLTGKSWMTSDLLGKFIYHATAAHGIRIY